MAKKKKGWGNKRKGSAHRKSAFSVGAATDNLAAASPADAAGKEEDDGQSAACDLKVGGVGDGPGNSDDGHDAEPAVRVVTANADGSTVMIDAALDAFVCRELDDLIDREIDDELFWPLIAELHEAPLLRKWLDHIENVVWKEERDFTNDELEDQYTKIEKSYEESVVRLRNAQKAFSRWGASCVICEGCGALTANCYDCFRDCDCEEGIHARYPWQYKYACEAGRPHSSAHGLSSFYHDWHERTLTRADLMYPRTS